MIPLGKTLKGANRPGEQWTLLLAVGGGSCCDYAKGVSVSAWCDEDPWEKYYVRMEEPANRLIPVGCVLTMVGTGSEMNGGSVITNHASKQKIGHVFGEEVFPKFSILSPKYTYTLPKYQMVAGIYDIMNHISSSISREDGCTSDYLMEPDALIYAQQPDPLIEGPGAMRPGAADVDRHLGPERFGSPERTRTGWFTRSMAGRWAPPDATTAYLTLSAVSCPTTGM